MEIKGSVSVPPLDALAVRTLRRRLLRWFAAFQRDLPWRKTRDPYAIWISEVMLQQTQVATVIPYYNRFLIQLPDIKTLANADIEAVLALWAGLGYYRRAHQMHRAAREILVKHDGQLPSRFAELLRLPGFGPYTAGAVGSIAFGQRVPAVDGNVLRVMTRILADNRNIRAPETQREFRAAAQDWLPSRRVGAFNQALMELGATICTVRNPQCRICPLNAVCRSFQTGTPMQYPVRTRRETRRHLYLAAIFVVSDRNQVLMARRPSAGLWAGLWELPSLEVSGSAGPPGDRWAMQMGRELGIVLRHPQPVKRINHTLTHREITVWIYAGMVPGRRDRGHHSSVRAAIRVPASGLWDHYADIQWMVDPHQLPLSVLAKKQLAAVQAPERRTVRPDEI